MGKYNKGWGDNLTIDSHETVLGHLLLEQQFTLAQALQYLAPEVAAQRQGTGMASTVTAGTAIAGGLFSIAAFTFLPIGYAIAPAIAGGFNAWQYFEAKQQASRRDAEFELHLRFPKLSKLLWELSETGLPLDDLIIGYDRLVDAIQATIEGIPTANQLNEQSVAGILKGTIEESNFLKAETILNFQPWRQQPEPPKMTEYAEAFDEVLDANESEKLPQMEPAKPSAISPNQQPQPAAAQPSRIEWNPAIDLGRNPQSALIAGTPGSGKGMLVSNAVRELRKVHPNLTVMMIDPKADEKESGYWEGTVDVLRRFCLMDCSEPDDGALWVLECIEEFRSLPSPKLLIFDELLAVAVELKMATNGLKAPQRFKKFVSGVIAQGDSLDVWLWGMSQSVQVEDVGVSGGVRGNLRAIGLISPKNIGAIEGLTSTRLIPQPEGGIDELRRLMKKSPVERAVYDAKIAKWLPMPKLENYSGYDRDSRQQTQPAAKWTATVNIDEEELKTSAKALRAQLKEARDVQGLAEAHRIATEEGAERAIEYMKERIKNG